MSELGGIRPDQQQEMLHLFLKYFLQLVVISTADKWQKQQL
jgi:hypothetical protein